MHEILDKSYYSTKATNVFFLFQTNSSDDFTNLEFWISNSLTNICHGFFFNGQTQTNKIFFSFQSIQIKKISCNKWVKENIWWIRYSLQFAVKNIKVLYSLHVL